MAVAPAASAQSPAADTREAVIARQQQDKAQASAQYQPGRRPVGLERQPDPE
jgi:hypothetical protein